MILLPIHHEITIFIHTPSKLFLKKQGNYCTSNDWLGSLESSIYFQENLPQGQLLEPLRKKSRREYICDDVSEFPSPAGTVLHCQSKDVFIVPGHIFHKMCPEQEELDEKPQKERSEMPQTKPIDLRVQVEKLRKLLWKQLGCPTLMKSPKVFSPAQMRQFCKQAGACDLFDQVMNIMCAPHQSCEVRNKNEFRAANILHLMMFGQSQKCAWFQHANTAFLRRNGLSEAGLSALWREGIAVHPRTARIMAKVIDLNYDDLVKGWIEDAMYKKCLLAFMVKRLDTAKAIPADSNKHNPNGVDSVLLTEFLEEKMPSLGLTYAASMPSWIRESFYDPEAEHNRLALHDYQESDKIRKMRSMENTMLIDSLEHPLKSLSDFSEVNQISDANQMGLSIYLEKYLVIQPGDWPAQFYLRQLVYSPDCPPEKSNLVPFIGALHVSLNGRENPVLINIIFFRRLYKAIFGEKKAC